MFTLFTFVGVVVVLGLVIGWGLLTLSVSQEAWKYPCLNKFVTIGNGIILLFVLGIIGYFNLWC